MVREAEYAESIVDFIHKMAIAQKEINETIYWLELMCETKYLSNKEYKSVRNDAVELIKMLTSSIKTAKQTLNTNH
jgi:four helix bundle protein